MIVRVEDRTVWLDTETPVPVMLRCQYASPSVAVAAAKVVAREIKVLTIRINGIVTEVDPPSGVTRNAPGDYTVNLKSRRRKPKRRSPAHKLMKR